MEDGSRSIVKDLVHYIYDSITPVVDRNNGPSGKRSFATFFLSAVQSFWSEHVTDKDIGPKTGRDNK